MELRLDKLVAPVTALEFVGPWLIAGEGSFIHIYCCPNGSIQFAEKVFAASTVHGIRTRKQGNQVSLGIFGSKSCRLASLCMSTGCVNFLLDEKEFDDWIWDLCWLEGNDQCPATVAVALAHNWVVRWDWKKNTVVESVHCLEKCILYSAKFIGSQWETLVLVAGTVFNQVVLWSVAGLSGESGRQEVLHRLSSHQGVIFSIAYCSRQQFLCSVSDDRSIRLWKVNFQNEDVHITTEYEENRTFYGEQKWTGAQFNLIHVLYGHSARVWDVKLLANCLVSVGEDSTCCVWRYDGQILHKFKGHKGKSIWSLAVNEEENTVATGGGDCGIRLWMLSNTDKNNIPYSLEIVAKEPHSHCRTDISGDFPRIVKFLNADNLTVMYNSGHLTCYCITSGLWHTLMSDENYKSYSILCPSPTFDIIAIGNINGCLKLIHNGECVEESAYSGKVFGAVWLSSRDTEISEFLLTTGPDGHVILWEVVVCPALCMKKRCSLTLPPGKQRWVSAACLLSDHQLLVCGDRGGSMHTFSLDDKEQNPIQSLWKIHGKAGVTHICFHNNLVYSAGRDGQYRQFSMEDGHLELLSADRVYKGLEWIAQMMFLGDDLVILGFHTDQFILYSVNTQHCLMSIPCGGGHRAWDFHLQCENGRARFAYIKTRDVALCESTLQRNHSVLKEAEHFLFMLPYSKGQIHKAKKCCGKSVQELILHPCFLQPSLHGREVTDIKHVTSTEDDLHVCATASEDTQINLLLYHSGSDKKCQVEVLSTMQGHISSVRAMAVSHSYKSSQLKDGVERKVLFSAGGRAQIRAWRICVVNNIETSGKTNCTGDSVKHKVADIHMDNSSTSSCPNCADNQDKSISTDFALSDSQRTNDHRTSENCISETSKCKLTCDIHNGASQKLSESTSHSLSAESKSYLKIRPNSFDSGKSQDSPCIKCWHENLASHMLCAKSRKGQKPWKKKGWQDPDPETRYMSLTVFRACEVMTGMPDYVHIVAAACSDGFVRLLCFDEIEKKFVLLAQGAFHDHCILKVDHIIGGSAENRTVLLLSAATDGFVAFWDLTNLVTQFITQTYDFNLPSGISTCEMLAAENLHVENPLRHCENTSERGSSDFYDLDDWDVRRLEGVVHSIQCHQSGVNAMALHAVGNGLYLLITGGDDNVLAVHMFRIQLRDNPPVVEVCAAKENLAHAAQITGVAVLDKHCLVSASIDQRLSLWQLQEREDGEHIQIKHCRSQFTSVADVAGLECWNSVCSNVASLAVCGVGLQFLHVTSASTGLS